MAASSSFPGKTGDGERRTGSAVEPARRADDVPPDVRRPAQGLRPHHPADGLERLWLLPLQRTHPQQRRLPLLVCRPDHRPAAGVLAHLPHPPPSSQERRPMSRMRVRPPRNAGALPGVRQRSSLSQNDWCPTSNLQTGSGYFPLFTSSSHTKISDTPLRALPAWVNTTRTLLAFTRSKHLVELPAGRLLRRLLDVGHSAATPCPSQILDRVAVGGCTPPRSS